jgi:saccharopine dehydrogenase-like NADP-dependent oxidoreductase
MRITIKGEDPTGQKEQITYQLYDEYDPQTRTSSMARTTGYTATAAANMILEDFFAEKGVFPPELVGKYDACFNYILKYLEERGVRYEKTVSLQ